MKTFRIILTVMTFVVMQQFANAQCPSNKVWTCRIDSCYNQECKCLFPSQVASWTATVPACKPYHGPPCCKGFRVSPNDSGLGIETSFEIYPNPASSLTTIAFTLSDPTDVTFQVFDMMGRLSATIANEFFENKINELTWDAGGLLPGIYFLKMQAGSESITKRITVIR